MIDDHAMDEVAAMINQRTPFGSAMHNPTEAIASFSQSGMVAADNLLTKALDRLSDGRPDAAEPLIVRAAGLPYDDHEQMWLGPGMAGLLLFTAISDHAEVVAYFDEFGFDDDEYAEYHDEPPLSLEMLIRDVRMRVKIDANAAQAGALRSVVQDLVGDADIHGIEQKQAQRMLELVSVLPEGGHGRDLPPDATAEQRTESIRASLEVTALVLEAIAG